MGTSRTSQTIRTIRRRGMERRFVSCCMITRRIARCVGCMLKACVPGGEERRSRGREVATCKRGVAVRGLWFTSNL